MTPDACLLCGGREAKVVFAYAEPDTYERTVGVVREGYARAWVRCADCGFHYSRHGRAPAQLDRIYDHAYRDTGRGFRAADAEATFRRVLALPPEQSESVQRADAILHAIGRLRAQRVLEAWAPGTPRLLDVGGASGVFAHIFRCRAEQTGEDWDAEIVDPSAQGSFIEAHGVRYHPRRFDRSFDAGRFHLVSMNYLLEHVGDPRTVLAAARECLLDTGLLYVEVPDAIAFQRLPMDDDIFNACHLWMFGPVSLMRLLDGAGFEPLTLTRARSPRGHFALGVLAGVA